MTKKSFMQGAVILGIAGIIIKVMGACFRIPLANMIGPEGMGYYQTAYPIYVLFLTLATAGIPVAISRMVSERIAVDNYYGANRVFRVSFILMLCIGVASASICYFGAERIIDLATATDEMTKGVVEENFDRLNAKYALMAIAPALFFVPLQAAYRGYFQGMQDMKPTATSQITEQFFRVVTGLALAYLFLGYGLEYAAAGASFGATTGAVAGLVTIGIVYLYKRGSLKGDIQRTKGREKEGSGKILARIAIIAVPITIGAAVMPIMNFIDVPIVMRQLQTAGWSYTETVSLLGLLSGFAGSLINFPQVLTQAVAMSLVPAVAAAYKQGDMHFLRDNVQMGLRTSIIIGLPCALGLMTLAEPIMKLLYPMQQASASSASDCLFVMAFGVIFLSTIQTLTGVLQGVGKQLIPVRNIAIGACAKIAVTYYLTGIYDVNVKGAAVGTVAAYIIAAVLNLLAVKKYTGTRFDMKKTFIKPIASALVMSLCAYVAYIGLVGFVGNAIATLAAIAFAAMVYVIMLFKTKSITRDEVARLPKGNKLVKIIDKFVK